jgi:hypothetical protein
MKVLRALLQISVTLFHFYEVLTLEDVEVNAVVLQMETEHVPPHPLTGGQKQIRF